MPNPLLARFAGEPTLVAPERRDRFEACLDAVMGLEHGPAMLREGALADDGFWPEAGSWKAAYRPYVVVDGVLQIPVKGVLLHDFSFAVGPFVTGYVYVRRAFERGMADDTVKGIALLCDSPGGEVAGCFDLVDAMHAGKGGKPVWAFAHEAAYSAAYAVASVADKIWVSRTGGVGSIGVVTAHTDVSGALEQRGVKVTFIYAGKHKIDGNSYEALPEDVQARMQARIDALYDVFVATVVRNRPSLKEKAVRATEALCFTAEEATRNGLADAVGSLDDAVAAFVADVSLTNAQDEQLRTVAAPAGRIVRTPAPTGTTRRTISVTEDDEKAVRAAERARMKSICDAPDARGRERQALALATSTSLSLEEAVAIMSASPRDTGAAGFLAEKEGRKELALEPENQPTDKTAIAALWDGVAAKLNGNISVKARTL